MDVAGSRSLVFGAVLLLVPAVIGLAGATLFRFPPGYSASESIAAGPSETEDDSASTTSTSAPDASLDSTPSTTQLDDVSSDAPVEQIEETTYRVESGDSLSEIADRFGTEWEVIAALNDISNPNLIFEGQVLRLNEGRPAVISIGSDTFDDTVFTLVAGRVAVSPELLKAVAWVSSEWNAEKIGPGGTLGIGQMEPETYDFIERELLDREVDPTDVASSTEAMAVYLSWLLEQAGGEVSPAIAAYYEGLVTARNIGWGTNTVAFVENVIAARDEFASAN